MPHLDLSTWNIPVASPLFSAFIQSSSLVHADPGVSSRYRKSRTASGPDILLDYGKGEEPSTEDTSPFHARTPRVHRELWPPTLVPVIVEKAANQPPRGYEGRSESRSTCRAERRGPLPRPTWWCGTMPLPASGGRASPPRGLAPRGYSAKAARTSRPDRRLRFSLLGRALCQHVQMPRIRCEDEPSLAGYPPQLGARCFSPSERWSFGVVRLGATVILTGAGGLDSELTPLAGRDCFQ